MTTESATTLDMHHQLVRAKRALRRRLYREMGGATTVYVKIIAEHVPYNGKGDRFELETTFKDGKVCLYEVTVYGPGRSYRIWEI